MRGGLARVLACLLVLGGCGGGGGGDGAGPDPETATIGLAAGRYGAVRSDGSVNEFVVDVGDDAANLTDRGFYGFSLNSIPSGATVTSARLTLRILWVRGDPFGDLGSLWVNHVDIGAALSSLDYGATPITPAVDNLTADPGPGPIEFDVAAAVQTDVAVGWATCDFRLQFVAGTDGDGVADYVRLPDLSTGPAEVLLHVTYVP